MSTPQPPDPHGSLPMWQPAPGSGEQYAAGSTYGPPPAYGSVGGAPVHTGPPRTETKAIIALVLAIAAYTPTIPFIGAIAALVLARMARRDIRASGGSLIGLGLCTAATVLSWIHLVLIVLMVLAFAALLILPFSFS